MKKKHENWSIDQVRTEVLAILTTEAPNQLKTNELSKKLGIKASDPEYDMVRQSLEELEEQGLIFRGTRRRYGRTIPQIFVEGRLEMTKQGRGFVIPSDRSGDTIDIDTRDLWTAFHGDTVRVKVLNALPERKPQGEITKVLKRGSDTVVGTLRRGRQLYIEPDDRRINHTITIRRNGAGEARIGDKVIAKLHEWNDPYNEPEGTIIGVLGRAGEMSAEIASIAAAYRLPYVFPDDVVRESEQFPDELTEEDLRGRRDLRDATIFTIDPFDARDFDDAISIEEHEDGDVTLGVHIADVSHYVIEGSALDEEAYRRGTSVYLVTGVIPMLPERLSNFLCSLRPNEDKLAYSVFTRLSPRGAIQSYEIVKSVIRSKRRFTYEEALEVLETGKGDYAKELLAINRVAHCLRQNRRRKGSIDFETTELKFKLDEEGMPAEVMQKRPTESTRLIEDCMLLANRVVAEHIGKGQRMSKRGGAVSPFIYRIHDVPPKDKLLELSNFVRSLGYKLPVDNIQPKDLQKLVDSAKGTEEEQLITEVTLRSMAKAVYSEFNIGHFGLAFDYYTHFTSPIRRYPDLIVHRLLFEYGQGMSSDRRQMYAQTLGPIADHSSERERAAVEAERESIKIAEVQFLKRHVGDVYEAVISGVMPFGIFAELKQFGIQGLISIRNVGDDFYTYDERSKSFRGRNTKKQYRMGDVIFVRVVRVDEVEAKIDLEMIDEREFNAEGGEYIEDSENAARSSGVRRKATKGTSADRPEERNGAPSRRRKSAPADTDEPPRRSSTREKGKSAHGDGSKKKAAKTPRAAAGSKKGKRAR